MKESSLQRITLDLPEDLHKKLKISCAVHETSMRKLVIEAIEEQLKKIESK